MFSLLDFQRHKNVTGNGLRWFPLPASGGRAANACFAACADVISLRETDINGFYLGGFAVSEVMDFIANSYLVAGSSGIRWYRG